jgi:sensor histidine kinase regulating citrate/malate metabolism
MRSAKKATSLRSKLILVSTVSTAVALLVCAGSLAYYDRWSFSQQLNNELATEGQVLGANCAGALEFGDRANAAEVLRAVSANRRIDIVVLYDKQGKEVVRYTRPEAIRRFPPRFSSQDIVRTGKFTSSNPVTYHGELLGSILLEGGEKDLATRTRSYFVVAGLLMTIAVMISIAVASRLQKRIFDPIAKLVSGMA